jgi:hypothetical protein
MKEIKRSYKKDIAFHKIVACICSSRTLEHLYSCKNMISTFGNNFPSDKELHPWGFSMYEALNNMCNDNILKMERYGITESS